MFWGPAAGAVRVRAGGVSPGECTPAARTGVWPWVDVGWVSRAVVAAATGSGAPVIVTKGWSSIPVPPTGMAATSGELACAALYAATAASVVGNTSAAPGAAALVNSSASVAVAVLLNAMTVPPKVVIACGVPPSADSAVVSASRLDAFLVGSLIRRGTCPPMRSVHAGAALALAATAGGMAKTRGVVATEAPTDTGAVGIACLRSSTHVLDSGTQVAGIDPDAIAANVSAAVWAVTAYVAQAPPRTARSAAAVTTAFSPGATETGTATGLAQLGVALSLIHISEPTRPY